MNLDRLTLQLELTTGFKDRQALAAQMAEELDQGQLARIARLLGHDNKDVRLGVIEILRTARFRPALKFLAAVTLQREGDERVFAARAVTELVRSDNLEDRRLAQPLCARWRAMDDEFLSVYAEALARTFGQESAPAAKAEKTGMTRPAKRHPGLEVVPAATASAGPGIGPGQGIISPDADVRQQAIARTAAQLDHPERAFADALLSTRHKGARLDLVHALERLGPQSICGVLEELLGQTDADLAALVLRSVRRSIPLLSPERKASVRAQLLAARSRLLEHELAREAMDDCLVAARPDDDLTAPVANADRIAPEAAFQLSRRLCALPEDERLEHLQTLVPALARAPRRALLFAELLEWGWRYFRPSRRDQVREILRLAEAKKFPDTLPPAEVAAIGRLYALAQRPGAAVPRNLIDALEQHHDRTTALAVVAVYRALATEEAANRLSEYLSDRDDEVCNAARDALNHIVHEQTMGTLEDPPAGR